MLSGLLLHIGAPVTWTAWRFDPAVFAGSVLAMAAYVRQTERLCPPVPVRYWLAFFAGVFATLIALVSPLDAAAQHMLTFHMLQHVLLSSIAAPLLVLGLPRELAEGLLSQHWLNQAGRFLLRPVVAGPLFIVSMWFWHLPPVYQQALVNQQVHALMHLCFLGTGILFWWPAFQEVPGQPSLSIGARMLYVFVSGFPMDLLALLFIASNGIVYPYYGLPPYLFGVSPISDQQVSGLVMGVVGEATSFITISVFFFRLGEDDTPTPAAAQIATRSPLNGNFGWLLLGSFAVFVGAIFGLSVTGS